MDTNILYLIYGGAIALVSSIFTMLLNFLIQLIDSNRKRKWDLEDHKRDKREYILLDNLAQAEKLITEIVKWHSLIPEKMDFFLDGDLDYSQYISEMKPLMNTMYLSPIIEIIDDKDLKNEFDKLGSITQNVMEIIPALQAKLREQDISRDDAGNAILNLSISASEPFHEIMKILNKLKIDIVSN